MRKRRVLALLLAFSMVIGTNGITVLAAGTDNVPEVVTENTEQQEETEPEQTGTESGEETGQKDNSGESSEEEKDTQETEDSTEEDNTEKDNDAESSETEEDIEEEEATEQETEEEEEKLPEEVAEAEVRMMSFTDETGMCVTYDANAAASYQYTVTDGVLTKVVDSQGNSLSGVIELDATQGITAIGTAFQGNSDITYVKLPAGVTSINANAFKGCSSLKGIYLPNTMTQIGDGAFENCSKLTQLAVPKNVQSIGARAFYQDGALFMLYMRDADYSSLVSIGSEAFKDCTALSKFCSDDSFVIPGRLESIGDSAFEGCKSIEAVDMNESVTTLGKAAFRNCGTLTSVVMSSKLTEISAEAFKGCNNLTSLTFKTGNTVIGDSAFEGCIGLGGVTLLYSIKTIGNYAFRGCSKLIRAEIASGEASIGDAAFYGCASNLTIVGQKDSEVQKYAENNSISFVSYQAEDEEEVHYYKCDIFIPGQTPGGTLTVKDANGKDPNTLNGNKGVIVGTKLFITPQASAGYQIVANSVKYNGRVITPAKNGTYSFTMPKGGALVTAEFESTSSGKTLGIEADISVELSNGATVNSKNEVDGAELKVGQTTRMFLIDSKDDNRAVKASKIKFASGNNKVATVDANGTIRAIAAGAAVISAVVTGYDGNTIKKTIVVNVSNVDVTEIKLKAVGYDASIIGLSQTADGINTATVDEKKLSGKAVSFRIKATAYDENGDDTAIILKWESSDKKVAVLSAASTSTTKTENTITIPQGASGEATITVTATNASKKTVTQKFLISVVDYTPRLASTAIVLNPNLEDGAPLEIISSYSKAIDADSVKLLGADGYETPDFKLTYRDADSDDDVKTFMVTQRTNPKDGVYNLKVSINDSYKIPVKITVKTSEPKPKLGFEKNQQKINLFYANDGTQIKPVISGLGTAKISEYKLANLSDTDDNKLFTENFQIDSSTGVITQKSASMIYGTTGSLKNKPVVTGYLVVSYEGYKDKIQTKFKITIPTQTVKPSYKLDKTAETFNSSSSDQTIEIQLLDTKNKNAKVNLNDGEFAVNVLADGTCNSIKNCTITSDGTIQMKTPTRGLQAGTVILGVTNSSWATGQMYKYTYRVNLSNADPKATLTKTTITLNQSYPEQTATFGLNSNQKDTQFAEEQTFKANSNARNQLQYDKLQVTYTDGVGKVEILDESIANGTYTYVCENVKRLNNKGNEVKINKVTLTIRVAKSVPTVTVKGAPAFNLLASNDAGDYVETAAVELSTKNVPQGYELDETATKATIQCTTKNCSEYKDSFDWSFADSKYENGVWSGKLNLNLLEELPKKTYAFTLQPVYKDTSTGNKVTAKEVRFNVRIYSSGISVALAAKGKVNLVTRDITEYTVNNSIVYTATLRNLKDTVVEAKVYDANGVKPEYSDDESDYFAVKVLDGKIYVTPKVGADIENNKTYSVMIWMKMKDYEFEDNGGTWSNVLKIRTAQVLPKITTNKTGINLYLSNKNYEPSFIISKSDVKALGKIESVAFGEKDTKAIDSFAIRWKQQSDGSLKVWMKPKNAVSYSCNSANKINMYVKFEGQGTNTEGVKFVMNVQINK